MWNILNQKHNRRIGFVDNINDGKEIEFDEIKQ
jgi:hypothetical protein